MDEDYIAIIRDKLYRKSLRSRTKSSRNMPRKEKKIKFTAINRYNSEAVFRNEKSDSKAKIKQRKPTPFKKETKRRIVAPIQNNDTSFEMVDTSSQGIKHPKHIKQTAPKKRKLVIAFSSDSSEEMKEDLLSPSKSEMEYFNHSFNKSNGLYSNESSSDSEDNVTTFNLDRFFNTYEPSLNESLTEAHSGIDNEFESASVTNCKIISSNENNETSDEEQTDEPIENGNVVVISDSETPSETPIILDDNVDTTIDEVADEIEKTIVLDEEENTPVVDNENQNDLECLGEYSVVDTYNLQDSTIVILKENEFVSIYGYLDVEVLYGKIEVYGSKLDKTSRRIDLYSPRGSALLQFVNVTTEDTEKNGINAVLTDLSLEGVKATNKCAVIKCTKLDDPSISFIEKYISQQIFPKLDTNLPQVIFQPTGTWNVIKESYAWTEILNNVKPPTKLLLAGGKGVGKSTFLRYAINRLLRVFDKIRIVDLDPGQSEFTVPGCLSIITVREPVFGPNYTHLRAAERSLVSNINVGQDPTAYIKCVESLMKYYNTLEQCPTLINYMGFVQGIGLNIVSSVITYVQPTEIVQIQSKNSRKNFISNLTRDVVKENCSLFMSAGDTLDYWHLRRIQAMNEDNEGWALEPRQSREMCVLAYLGQMMSDEVDSLLSHKLPIYEVKLSSLKLTNLDREELPPAAVNASLVTLCSVEETTNIFVCLGYGVVRGIDLESDKLVLITPTAPSVLEEVSHLVLGNVSLPPSVYMTPDGIKGTIPYVMQGELVSLGQITKRTYLPMNKK